MGRPVRELRADAVRNRECILEAARATFAERGANAPLEEIARRAGVGIATLYRRFPSRADLVAAAFEPKLCAYAEAARAATAEADPWLGFCQYVRSVCAMQAADAGFADVLTLTFPPTRQLEKRLFEASASVSEVIAAAQAAGKLRSDFVHQDLVLVLMANAGVVNAMRRRAPAASERLVAYALDAFAAPGNEPLPPPVDPRGLARALRASRRRPA
jgi:AcrR family transcriptional regulator